MKRLFFLILSFVLLAALWSLSSETAHAKIVDLHTTSTMGYWKCYDDGSFDSCHRSIIAVSTFSDTNSWAVGEKGLILHWDGNDWSAVSSPTTQTLSGIEMLSATIGWAVGGDTSSVILYWDGDEWSEVASPISSQLNDLDMLTATDGWAVGPNGIIIHWDGSDWSAVSSPINGDLSGIDMVSANDGWAVGGSTIIHWNGLNWTQSDTPDPNIWLFDVDMMSANDGWAIGTDYNFFRWDGNEWSVWKVAYSSNGAIIDVSMNSPTDGWAVGDFGAIFHWNGLDWEYVTGLDSSKPSLNAVSVQDAAGWIVGGSGSILQYEGGDWAYLSTGYPQQLNDVDFSSASDGWAVGNDGRIIHWDGTDWALATSPTTNNITSVAVVSENNAWAVGGNSVLRWDGYNWAKVSNSPNLPFRAIDANATDVWLSGGYVVCNPTCSDLNGFISHWNGTAWTTSYIPHVYFNSISMTSPSNGWAVGDYFSNSQPYPTVYQWNGSVWSVLPVPPMRLSAVSTFGSSDTWAIGQDVDYACGSLHWDGNNWNEIPCPSNFSATSIDIVAPSNVWAVGYQGAIINWDGVSWNIVGSPVSSTLNSIKMISNNEGWIVGSNGVILQYVMPNLSINYSSGAPGSFFNLFGSDFPPDQTVTIYVNGRTIGTAVVNQNGEFVFTLSTLGADDGIYNVVASVNPSASARFILDSTADTRPQEGDYLLFEVPAGIAVFEIYLPLVLR
jgi:hypothetical protein